MPKSDWKDDVDLSNLAARVAEKHGVSWEQVVVYVEKVVERGLDEKHVRRAYGAEALALGKDVEELDDLERRVALLKWLRSGWSG